MLRIQAEALTYDDVSLVPAHSTVLPKDVSLETRLTRDLRLKLPIVSAAMDTVTEARLAIAMAQLGGIGILALARACLPFFLIVGASLLLITWIPWLSLALL